MTQFTSLKLRQGMAVKPNIYNNFYILELIESSSGNTVIWYNYFLIIYRFESETSANWERESGKDKNANVNDREWAITIFTKDKKRYWH